MTAAPISVPYGDVAYVRPVYPVPQILPADRCESCTGTGTRWPHLFDVYDGNSMIVHEGLCEACRGCGHRRCGERDSGFQCRHPRKSDCATCDGTGWQPRVYGPDGEEIWVKVPCRHCTVVLMPVLEFTANWPHAPGCVREQMQRKAIMADADTRIREAIAGLSTSEQDGQAERCDGEIAESSVNADANPVGSIVDGELSSRVVDAEADRAGYAALADQRERGGL